MRPPMRKGFAKAQIVGGIILRRFSVVRPVPRCGRKVNHMDRKVFNRLAPLPRALRDIDNAFSKIIGDMTADPTDR